MAKRDVEELVQITGIKTAEISGTENVSDGVVVSSKGSPALIVLDDDKRLDDGGQLAWYGSYGEKPPNFSLPVYDPATKATSRPKPPPKTAAK